MAAWGRNADSQMAIEPRPRRLGVWSLICALVAFALVIAMLIVMVNTPNDAPEWQSSAATFGLVISFLIVAPILHIVGVVLAIVGLARGGESKIRCVLGILLNVILITVGIGLAFAAGSGIGAYT